MNVTVNVIVTDCDDGFDYNYDYDYLTLFVSDGVIVPCFKSLQNCVGFLFALHHSHKTSFPPKLLLGRSQESLLQNNLQ